MSVKTHVELLQDRRTRIIATIGPSCSDVSTLEKLILAGVNVFRLNMSHGDHSSHREAFLLVTEVSRRLKMPVAVLADLCGPKIRTGRFPKGGIELVTGRMITVPVRSPGEGCKTG
jgi:pyruvate kinase